jgi:hypothetical protein
MATIMWIKTDTLMRELGQKKPQELSDRIIHMYKKSPFVKQYYTELLVEPGSSTRIVKANDLMDYLRTKDKNQRISEIVRLYKANIWVQDDCALWLSVVSDDDMLTNYQQRLKKELLDEKKLNKRVPQLRLSITQQILTNYRHLTQSATHIADLMLYYLECGAEASQRFSPLHDSFYSHMVSVYQQTLQWLVKHQLLTTYRSRVDAILQAASDVVECDFDIKMAKVYDETISSSAIRSSR